MHDAGFRFIHWSSVCQSAQRRWVASRMTDFDEGQYIWLPLPNVRPPETSVFCLSPYSRIELVKLYFLWRFISWTRLIYIDPHAGDVMRNEKILCGTRSGMRRFRDGAQYMYTIRLRLMFSVPKLHLHQLPLLRSMLLLYQTWVEAPEHI